MEPSSTTTSAARTDTEATAIQNQTGITPDTLRKTLIQELGAEHVEIEDMSGMSHIAPMFSVLRLRNQCERLRQR